MGVTFPNESPEYRQARDKLLHREAALRREMEAVAAELRALPPGESGPAGLRVRPCRRHRNTGEIAVVRAVSTGH